MLPFLLVALLAACHGSVLTIGTGPDSTFALDLTTVVSGLESPVHLTAPAGDARLFVAEQPGRIRVVKNGQLLATPFLDITSRVLSGGERGLLSMAFDPAYGTNGRFYVYYTSQPSGDIVVERYGATPGADVASPTPTLVIRVPHAQYSNHNGGLVAFGPDGMLYIGTGDGGGAGDPLGSGQGLNTLLGKVLRIDVHSLPYTIPSSNPFAGQAGRRGEIWAYGLRNPWRFAFDSLASGGDQLWIADVGQNAWEEIDVAPASTGGIDYGWNVMEGTHCYTPSVGCNTSGLRLPALEYGHDDGCSIIGGHVYRGAALPELRGHFFYADYCGGWLRSATPRAGGGLTSREWLPASSDNVLSLGADSAGELYVLRLSGRVEKIVRGTPRSR